MYHKDNMKYSKVNWTNIELPKADSYTQTDSIK